MDIKPDDLSAAEMHKLLIGCVVPRPIAWVSSQDANGTYNLAPYSFFNAICAKPPTLMIAATYRPAHPDGQKDTLRNIQDVGEYVINIVTEPNMVAMNQSATDYPEAVDEFAEVGVTPAPSVTVRPPRVAEAPINFECVLQQIIPVGDGRAAQRLCWARSSISMCATT
ncbi:MAG: flavin reductase family protein [Chloroflexaceae bacterium]|nr:flavin reductase family protein [Chloroflexaceae bacterium]